MNTHQDYTVDQLSEMLIDSILKEQFLNKENLKPKVAAFIKAFVNLKKVPKNYNAYESKSVQAKRLRTIEQRGAEIKFWQSIVHTLDPDNMERYFKQHKAMLVSKGFMQI
jgi:hypothetical protein